MKPAQIVTVSVLVLTTALVGGLALLLAARARSGDDAAARERALLAAEHDELRARAAAARAQAELVRVPARLASAQALRDALERCAAAVRRPADPSQAIPGTAVVCALEYELPPRPGGVWTSSPVDPGERAWVLTCAAAATVDAPTSSAHEVRDANARAAAWTFCLVGDRLHVGALYWLSPRTY